MKRYIFIKIKNKKSYVKLILWCDMPCLALVGVFLGYFNGHRHKLSLGVTCVFYFYFLKFLNLWLFQGWVYLDLIFYFLFLKYSYIIIPFSRAPKWLYPEDCALLTCISIGCSKLHSNITLCFVIYVWFLPRV